MTDIVIPISTPGASESAASVNRAADALEKLAKSTNSEREANKRANEERRRAKDELAAQAKAAKEAERAATEAAREQDRQTKAAAQARAAAARESANQARAAAAAEKQAMVEAANNQAIVDQRLAASARTTVASSRAAGQWSAASNSAGSTRSKLINLGGTASAAASNLGISNPAIGAGFGLAQQLGPEIVALSGAALAGFAAAAVAATISFVVIKKQIDKHNKNFEKGLELLDQRIAFSNKEGELIAGRAQKGLSVFERTKSAALAAVAAKGDYGINRAESNALKYKISMNDAFSMVSNNLTDNQEQAAAMAADTLGISVSDASAQIAQGRLAGSPEQIVSMLSRGKFTPKQIASRAKNIAQSDYGKLYKTVASTVANQDEREFSLTKFAHEGAMDNAFKSEFEFSTIKLGEDQLDAYKKDLRIQMITGGSKENMGILQRRIDYLTNEYIPGQRIVNAAGR